MQEKVTDLDASLTRHPLSHDFVVKSNEDTIKQHIDMLLLSGEYACIGRPFVCAGLRHFIFEDSSDATIQEIKTRVREALKHETRVTIGNLDVVFDESTKYVSIKIIFKFVDTDKTFSYETRLKRIL